MDENANVYRSPFRRFPWVQLVFCVACLVMCGYMWMRFSYCWDFTVRSLAKPSQRHWRIGAYVRVQAKVHPYYYEVYPPQTGMHLVVEPSASLEDMFRTKDSLHIVTMPGVRYQPGVVQEFRGHVIGIPDGWGINTTASRFHPSSIAGLVVGAMGVFIFGLYLLRWVKERRTS
jgi:hypothetical protein